MSSSQSEGRLMMLPIRIANNVFLWVRKMMHPIRNNKSVWVSQQNFQLFRPSLCKLLHRNLSPRGFLVETWKTLEWNSFIYLTVNDENCREPTNNSGRGKTEWDIHLFCLLLTFKLAIFYSNSFLFWYIQNKKFALLVIPGLPHTL